MSRERKRVKYPSDAESSRTAKRAAPGSPWQQLVTDRAKALGLSWREIHQALGPKGPKEHTTVWAWTRRPKGYPASNAYTPEINERLAHVLKLSPRELAAAYEASRLHSVSGTAIQETAALELPLDPDVLLMLENQARRTRMSFREVLNGLLRKSLRPAAATRKERFVVQAADMGDFTARPADLEGDLEVAAFLESTRRLEASLQAP
jgi:hypothetical protein